ncbi:hypothetical protein D3C81_2167530 [compost metagenome]
MLVGRGQWLVPTGGKLARDVEVAQGGGKTGAQCLDALGVHPVELAGLATDRVEVGEVGAYVELR